MEYHDNYALYRVYNDPPGYFTYTLFVSKKHIPKPTLRIITIPPTIHTQSNFKHLKYTVERGFLSENKEELNESNSIYGNISGSYPLAAPLNPGDKLVVSCSLPSIVRLG